jgi:hypothetical protein
VRYQLARKQNFKELQYSRPANFSACSEMEVDKYENPHKLKAISMS